MGFDSFSNGFYQALEFGSISNTVYITVGDLVLSHTVYYNGVELGYTQCVYKVLQDKTSEKFVVALILFE